MIEGLPVLRNLLLGKSLGVSDEYLVLSLIESPVDGGNELAPAGTEGLHGILTVRVVKDQGSLQSLKTHRKQTKMLKWNIFLLILQTRPCK